MERPQVDGYDASQDYGVKKALERRRRVTILGTRGYPSFYGGFETAIRKIAPFLIEDGWDVTVYGRRGATRADDEDLDLRVATRTTWGVERRSLSTLTYGLSSALDTAIRKPDVVLVMNCANGLWLPILRARGIPSVVNVDGMEWERAKWGRVAKAVFRLGARMTARFASRLIFDAEAIASRWKVEFGRDGYFIPYGGKATPILAPLAGLEHRKYVLFVARLVPENTVAEFVEAAWSLSESHQVVIVGSSGYGSKLDAAVQNLASARSERVRWLGHVTDDRLLDSLWQHSGVYFHGHSVGGTNPALVQAMACGAPIVARRTPYNEEVLQDAGVLVDASSAGIAEAVLDLLGDAERQKKLSDRATGRAREHYTWDMVERAYSKVLMDAAVDESA